MIAFGIEETVAASKRFPELSCPLCRTVGEIELAVLRQQVTVGFVPMLAGARSGVARCHSCQQAVTLRQGGEPFGRAYQALKATVRTPLYLYSGLIASLLGLVAIFGYVAYEEKNNPYAQPVEQAHLDSPRPGDLYEVSVVGTAGGSRATVGHTLARVEAVGDGAVTLRWHRSLVPISQRMPLLRDFPTGAADFDGETVEVSARHLSRKSIVPRGPRDDRAEEAGSVVATLRPDAG